MRNYCELVLALVLACVLLVGCVPPAESSVPTTIHTTVPTTSTVAPTTPTTTVPTIPTTIPTVPTTVPTVPTTVPTQPEDPYKFPEELENNVYLIQKNKGFSEEMLGKVMLTIIFLSDTESSWTSAEIENAKKALDRQVEDLEKEADKYSADVDLQVTYLESKILGTYDYNDPHTTWAKLALAKHGMSQGMYTDGYFEQGYKVDEAPVIFVMNCEGRAYASCSIAESTFEYVVMYSSELNALRHELCHVFGAVDFYFPDETVAAAQKNLPDSLMLKGATGTVDPLTAYLIGWTGESLLPDAEAFLRETNHITQEYLEQAQQQDSFTGYGTKEFNGCTYTGYMVQGVPHGEGTCTWDNGVVYTGNWNQGTREGYGEMYGANGFSYKGQWKKDQYNGTGTLVYSGGKATYTGEFKDGVRHGTGTYTSSNGDVYSGQWFEDDKHGEGTYTWTNGNVYTGEWVYDNRTGHGVMTYAADGSRYEGEFLNNKRHGAGVLYKADGTMIEGTWQNDKLVEA